VRLLRDALDLYFADAAPPAPSSRVSPSAREAFFARVADELGARPGTVLDEVPAIA